MSNRLVALSAAAALTLAAFGSTAIAAEAGAVHGAKTVGALTFATLGVATSTADVRRQGGFATAGAAEWSKAPSEPAIAGIGRAMVYGGGSIGALALETRGLATSAADVRRQGGAMTASAVRWASAPAGE